MSHTEIDISPRAEELHARAIVINALCSSNSTPKKADAEFGLPEIMNDGGVTAVNLTISVKDDFKTTIATFTHLLNAIDRRADDVRLARTAADIRAAKAAGVPAIVAGFQNSDPFDGNLAYVSLFARLGLRISQLTYQRRNLAADGTGEEADAGLSVFGRSLVQELNKERILIDLSHTGERSSLETIELSSAPVAVTHACLQSFNPVRRNKTDETIKAMAARGGVFGMNAIARLISPNGNAEGATVEQFVDQIDYLADMVGIDHVGLGLDINEGLTPEGFAERRKGFLTEFPELRMGGDFPFEHYYAFGLTSMRNMRAITETLVRRGYSDEDVLKVLGGNFLRLFEEVWGA